MNAQMTNGQVRELVAERDWLRVRNVQLSESLDETAARYIAVLERLGFDREGNPIPEPAVAPALEWVDNAERFDDDKFMPPAPKVRD